MVLMVTAKSQITYIFFQVFLKDLKIFFLFLKNLFVYFCVFLFEISPIMTPHQCKKKKKIHAFICISDMEDEERKKERKKKKRLQFEETLFFFFF